MTQSLALNREDSVIVSSLLLYRNNTFESQDTGAAILGYHLQRGQATKFPSANVAFVLLH